MSFLRSSVAPVVCVALIAVVVFVRRGVAAAAPAGPSAPAGVENPEYTVWAKFKEGATFTLAQDREIGGVKKVKVHTEVVNRLVRITPERAVVESASVVEVGEEVTRTTPARKEIPARTERPSLREAGEAEVEAMGRRFKCKVYEFVAEAADPPERDPRNPRTKPATRPQVQAVKGKMFLSPEVPGGVVKAELAGPDGPAIFVLKEFEAK
jgi:hypothetical protein